jgi:hypothetical protein
MPNSFSMAIKSQTRHGEARYGQVTAGLLLFLATFFHALPLQASTLYFRVGPPSVGNGGSNPMSIPPINPVEWEFSYLSPSDFESNISLTPGLLFGQRGSLTSGMYVSLGGGLIIDANGAGIGPYASIGWESSGTVKFNAEFKQAAGLASRVGLICPYALRIGVGFEF